MSTPPVKDGLLRHVEGWQAGVVALVIAGVGLVLGAPRAVQPTEVPLPVVDGAALTEVLAIEMARAAELDHQSEADRARDFDVRAAGERLRQYGEADLSHDRDRLSVARTALIASLHVARETAGDDALLRLRAYQLRTFLDGVAAWERTGIVGDELTRVGGDFIGIALQSGWVAPPHRMLADRHVLAALFLRRFAEVSSLRDGKFAMPLASARAGFAFLLAHPPPGGAQGPQLDPAIEAIGTWAWTLRKVEELAVVDKEYPADLGRGVAYYQLGDARASLLAFRRYLAANPDGPYTLRARNWLAAAFEVAGPTDDGP